MESPVIFVFFNRPALTRQSFSTIRLARPKRLHLIADGPRPGRIDDFELCQTTKAIVEGLIDWPCEVTRDYSETNLGCGQRLATGLTTAFALLGEAIVLEDDIVPHPDFFAFCDRMLREHRRDEHIHSISGFQPLRRYAPAQGGAVPSALSWIWGWASWQRAWKDYRFDISSQWRQPAIRDRIQRYAANELNFEGHRANFEALIIDHLDTWDFQWTFSLLERQRVSLVSSVNLIRNLGFDASATHTVEPQLYLQDLPSLPCEPARRTRPTDQPDRLHDKLFGEIIHGRTRGQISRLRFAARFPGIARTLIST